MRIAWAATGVLLFAVGLNIPVLNFAPMKRKILKSCFAGNRKWLLLSLLLLACHPSPTNHPQDVNFAKSFIHKLANNANDDFSEWVDADAIRSSRRLGIEYTGIRHKFLIQYDLPPRVRNGIRSGKLKVEAIETTLEDGYSRVTVADSTAEKSQNFYFKNRKLISPVQYFTRDWQKIDTRYFRFLIGDRRNFNDYAAARLEEFVEKMITRLQLTPAERETLEREKIIYVLCNDEKEVAQISGVSTRGVYVLGFDQIVSMFNAHYHEVAHLLLNFKLKQLPLYANPFLQEGFASAVGGRGDKARDVILSLGKFLQKSGFLTYPELLKSGDFQKLDPSLSYSLSAAYNAFLIEKMGIPAYLDFYNNHCSYSTGGKPVLSRELPRDTLFAAFLETGLPSERITFPKTLPSGTQLMQASWGAIWESDTHYFFRLRGSIRITPPHRPKQFVSKEFREIFPDVRYHGEKYVLEVSESEVKLFNFYTATLDAFVAQGLSLTKHDIRDSDGNFVFAIRKSVFDQPLADMSISQ